MLEMYDLTLEMDKTEHEQLIEELGAKLCKAQRLCREAEIPVIIVFEGWSASGKGSQISSLMQWLDPRGFEVYNTKPSESEGHMYPHLKKFWHDLPADGRIGIFNRSWYRTLVYGYEDGKRSSNTKLDDILSFERTLTDSGVLIIKLFLHVSQKEQKKRLEKLQNNASTAWRVQKSDLKQNKRYDKLLSDFDKMLVKTDHDCAKWTIIEATDSRYSQAKIFKTVVTAMEEALKMKNDAADGCSSADNIAENSNVDAGSSDSINHDTAKYPFILDTVDLTLALEPAESKERRKAVQKNLAKLHNKMYIKRVPAIALFEGWDAAGKGGVIKRLAKPLDPRGYKVAPFGAPNDVEKVHHYLWRFWNEVPKAGHMTIFDRSWYGRVMVERVEGFCTQADWERAYDEINEFEKQLVSSGIVLMKFWLHIDQDEQLSRFKAREENPDKQWKITEEDWRNRDKWDAYMEAVNDMLRLTSTDYAPWTIVEANNKPYARVKVLETVCDRLSSSLK